MDWSALIWFFSGVGATLVGVIAQYWVSTRLEDRRRKTEFYQSRLEKIEPWLAELHCALMNLNCLLIDTIQVPGAGSERPTKQYWSELSLEMLRHCVDEIHNLRNNPPRVVFASLDPEIAGSLDSIFRKIDQLSAQAGTVMYVEGAIGKGLQLSEEWLEQRDPPIMETSEALRVEIARLAALLKELAVKTDVRKRI